MAGGAQAKMSTWVSKPNQSLISKVTKKRVGFNLKMFVFALLKTVHCRAERNPGRIGRLFNCTDRCFFIWRETYENERISIKNSLPYIKCVLHLSCVVYGPIYDRLMSCTVNGFLSL